MDIYHYSNELGEYLNTSIAKEDPLNPGNFLIPALATTKQPPAIVANEKAVFDEFLNEWSVLADYRATTYYNTPDQTEVLLSIGQTPDTTLTDLAPVDPEEVWMNDHWELPLDILKERKRSELKVACAFAIEAGVDSDALGTIHHYPTTKLDQQNMNGLWSTSQERGVAGEPCKFWCRDGGGVWARRDHTTAQLSVAALTVADHVIAQQNIYEAKLAEVDAAADSGMVDLIVW